MPAHWKESYDKSRQHIKNQIHHFADKGLNSQSYGFPSSHDGCESWTIKKAEHRRTDAFMLWCWRRLVRGPWAARRSNQSILQEINTEYSLEGLMLKHQFFGHVMGRANSLEKPLMLEKIEGKGWGGGQRMRWSDSITYSMHMNIANLGNSGEQRSLVCYIPWGGKESDYLATEQVWRILNLLIYMINTYNINCIN